MHFKIRDLHSNKSNGFSNKTSVKVIFKQLSMHVRVGHESYMLNDMRKNHSANAI